ncbi:hypothetical protein MTR67_016954 [Solanum verrucosum]|uniref:Uncharacterized protein n=1 Tax=Solanum verrucosum TaxID=315347 RepID=A0AAF0QPC1_SOLVR|nr:hypothetical protein MTR67_016954 [Solanum verrucosum]
MVTPMVISFFMIFLLVSIWIMKRKKKGKSKDVASPWHIPRYWELLDTLHQMEVLTKRRPTDEEMCNENLELRGWITQSFSGSMMDVANHFPEEEQIPSKSEIYIASIELALDCTKEMPKTRISMKEVVKIRLNKIKNTFLET